MPLQKIQLKPGVNRENTRYTTEGGWYEMDKVRFRQGTPEKIGGWLRNSANTFLGICRSLWNWVTLNGRSLIGVGTNLKFYIQRGGVYFDITPIRTYNYTTTLVNPFTTNIIAPLDVLVTDVAHGAQIGDLVRFSGAAGVSTIPAEDFNKQHVIVAPVAANTYHIIVATAAAAVAVGGGTVTASYIIQAFTLGVNPFATVNTSTTITVTHAAHGAFVNDFVTFSGATATGGIPAVDINKEQQISLILNVNSYEIVVATAATSNAVGGGAAVRAAYQINTGPMTQIPATGWGSGTWGAGPWGIGTESTVTLQLWNQQNFGEDLVFGPRGGGLYYWSAALDVTSRGVAVTSFAAASDVPLYQSCLMVSDSSRFVFAFGTNEIGSVIRDPMLIRWSNQESVSMWTPTVLNQAGDVRLSHGSEIIAVLQVRQEILVWTDQALYSLQYLGPPYIWGIQILADNTSIISPNAMAVASGVTFWMGVDKFYKYDGSAKTLRCDLWQYIFNDSSKTQQYQVCAGTNEGFNEVWWFYCSANSLAVDRYVVYNYLEDIWYYGYLGRTAWLDTGIQNYPIAATYANNIVQHENGVDDGTYGINALLPLASNIVSSQFDIGDGHNFSFINRVLPDVTFRGSTAANPALTMELQPLTNSGSGFNSPESVGGDSTAGVARTAIVPIEQFTGQVYIRVRGRQLQMKITSTALGVQWQLGSPRIDIRQDGRAGGNL